MNQIKNLCNQFDKKPVAFMASDVYLLFYAKYKTEFDHLFLHNFPIVI